MLRFVQTDDFAVSGLVQISFLCKRVKTRVRSPPRIIYSANSKIPIIEAFTLNTILLSAKSIQYSSCLTNARSVRDPM